VGVTHLLMVGSRSLGTGEKHNGQVGVEAMAGYLQGDVWFCFGCMESKRNEGAVVFKIIRSDWGYSKKKKEKRPREAFGPRLVLVLLRREIIVKLSSRWGQEGGLGT